MSNKKFKKNNRSFTGIKVDNANEGYRVVQIDKSQTREEDIRNFVIGEVTLSLAGEFFDRIFSGESIEDLTSFTIKSVKEHYYNGNKLPQIPYENIKKFVPIIWAAAKVVDKERILEMTISMWSGLAVSFKCISVENFNRYLATSGFSMRLENQKMKA